MNSDDGFDYQIIFDVTSSEEDMLNFFAECELLDVSHIAVNCPMFDMMLREQYVEINALPYHYPEYHDKIRISVTVKGFKLLHELRRLKDL